MTAGERGAHAELRRLLRRNCTPGSIAGLALLAGGLRRSANPSRSGRV
jgi:hypothetical protein